MKVLYITDRDDKFGAPKSMIEMIKKLKEKNDIKPIVITATKNDINRICDENEIENYVTYHQKHLYVITGDRINDLIKFLPRYIRYKVGNLIAKIIIKRKIDMDKIDIIHTNTSSLDIGGILASKYNKKHIMHIREFGDKDFNMKSYRKKYVQFFNRTTDYFFAISEAIKKGWVEKGIEERKIIKVYNGIDISDILVKDYKNDKNLKLKMIISGSICEGKGQKEIVQALTKLPNYISGNIKLDIIGDGLLSYKKEIEDVINKNNLKEIVNILPYNKDLRKILNKYDIGIVCSRSEGFGRITVEYMATKLIVIASDTGANQEIVDDGVNGFIYKYNNIKDLANKIIHIYNNRKDLLKIGEKARNKVIENFTSDINVKNVYSNYKRIVKK